MFWRDVFIDIVALQQLVRGFDQEKLQDTFRYYQPEYALSNSGICKVFFVRVGDRRGKWCG
jgi:hypothetical protein